MSRKVLFEAPAGSGKTTSIQSYLAEWGAVHSNRKALCITYTNRATEELKQALHSETVDVSTIHSFFASLGKRLFCQKQVVEHYLEKYSSEIADRIANKSNNEATAESNERFRERFGEDLTAESVGRHLQRLYYTEGTSNSILGGGLSHDRLLGFICSCANRYPRIHGLVYHEYDLIIIDEYQDTRAAVLSFFDKVANESGGELRLYGDRMQQIYEPESRELDHVLSQFHRETSPVTNYRSTSLIVDCLNKIYSDPSLVQSSHTSETGSQPTVHFTSDTDSVELKKSSNLTLVLDVYSSTLFEKINAQSFYRAFGKLPGHSYNSAHPAKSVLLDLNWRESPSPLIGGLYGLLEIERLYERGHIGKILKLANGSNDTLPTLRVERHPDKSLVRGDLEKLISTMQAADSTIGNLLDIFAELVVIRFEKVSDWLADADLADVLACDFRSVRAVWEFADSPVRSTQHGVKGEGHDKVIFRAQTSKRTPIVRMDNLFRLWQFMELNLETLEHSARLLSSSIADIEASTSMKLGNINAASHAKFESIAAAGIDQLLQVIEADQILRILCGNVVYNYRHKPTVGGIHNVGKLVNSVRGTVDAYRLFYVGCSRARRELDVIIDRDEIDDLSLLSERFQNFGFAVDID